MTVLPVAPTTRFPSPEDTTAVGPPESRGIPRDGVRLLVARPDRLDDVHFRDIGRFLRRGDVLVVNTSADRRRGGRRLVAAPRRPRRPPGDAAREWLVGRGAAQRSQRRVPVLDARPGEQVHLGEGVVATLVDGYP